MREGKFFENREEQPEMIEVEQGVWKVAKAPDIIETTGLGPCLGIILYDKKEKQAAVGHFANPEQGELENFFVQVRQLFLDKKNLKVYVGGMCYDLMNAPDFVVDKAARDFVVRELKNQGFQKKTSGCSLD